MDFDTTQNLFIEGDNLKALKLLQETYLNKVKMIYIDPPYNTGTDFIYEDNFSESIDEYLIKSFQQDENKNRLVATSDSSGRFHSDWLTMLFSRLRLSKSLLCDDGVIFISIDDNESPNIRKMCDEIFGINNFLAEFVWKRRAPSALADNNVSSDHEYVICYQSGELEGFKGIEKDFKNYTNPDNDPRGDWVLGDLTVGMTASMRPNQAYNLVDPKTGKEYPFNPNRVWTYIPSSMKKMIDEGRVVFPDDITKRPMRKRFKNELKSTHNPLSSLLMDKVGLNTEATRTMQKIMDGNIFDYSKPVSLLSVLIPQVTKNDDVVLDFFSGSSTTAHAVIALNANDGRNRKFIMIQLPEEINEKAEAYKAGYTNISEIGKERIRRAGKKILESKCHKDWNKDIGFRVLKVDTSNMKDVYYNPDKITQKDLYGFVDNVKEDRTPEDLLFQVLLDWGVNLTLPIKSENIGNKTVFFVDKNALLACFDENIDEEFVKKLAEHQPLRVVFRDNGYGSDSTKINIEQIFKLISPSTEVKTL